MSTPSYLPVSLSTFAEMILVGSPRIRPLSLPSDPGVSSHGPHNSLNISQGHYEKRKKEWVQGECCRHAPTISTLSDDVLLEIFDFCRKHYNPSIRTPALPEPVWDWDIMVHVCQRWRQIVFASPLRLNLQILCTRGARVRKNLDIWPTFPINIEYITPHFINLKGINEDNIIAALEQPARVCAVSLRLTSQQLGKLATVMQEPFPALTHLFLSQDLFLSHDRSVPVLPNEFLGRSAPCLQNIRLDGIAFPVLPALLLSTSDLVTLDLRNIPRSGYISPEALVIGLSTLTRLRYLNIGFRSPASRPDRIRPPPSTRAVLPAITSFGFHGVREYLEDFTARIDAPRLHAIQIYFFNQLLGFEVPQLSRFIRQSVYLKRPMRCTVESQDDRITFFARLIGHIPESFNVFSHQIAVGIVCKGIDWQVSHLGQVLNQMSAVLSNMVYLAIYPISIRSKPEDMDDIEWLQLLRPFSSVRTLFVSRKFARHISCTLEDIARVMPTEVLPALDMLCLEDQSISSVQKFISVRREFGCPVAIINTEAEVDERRWSYS